MDSETEKDIRTISDLVDVEDRSVLELGCGDGRIAFGLADKAREIVAVDIDAKVIEIAKRRDVHGNVTFLVEDMEDFDLGREFDVILSVGLGYMYLRDLPKAIKNVSRHLDAEGAALLICGSPTDEYQRIVDLLVEENVRTVAFYSRFEENLSNHFAFEKKTLKGQLDFPDFEEVLRCFRRELKEEYQKDMNDRQEEKLREFFQKQGRPTVERDSRAYICRHL